MLHISIFIIMASICGQTHSLNLTATLSKGIDIILTAVEKLNIINDETGTNHLNTSEIIEYYGFTPEEHEVETFDGYILSLFRVKSIEIVLKRPPVIIIHGLFSTSDYFFGQGLNSLPFVLAAQGYDVWLGNTRGNTYSKKHKTLSPDDPKYWDFSWHENGIYDVPAMIDFCLEKTKKSQVTYIGHSQGTTTALVALSERPEYNKKLNAVIALAPVAWMSNLTSPVVQALADVRLELAIATKALGINSLLTNNAPCTTVFAFCGSSKLLSVLCNTFLFPLFGFSYSGINYEFSSTQFNHYCGGGSTKQVLHHLQNVKTKLFQKFDYGPAKNKIDYGVTEAPSYPTQNITAPVLLFYSINDWLVSIKDVNQLMQKLPNGNETYEVPRKTFNHMDYVWAVDANSLVYSKVLEVVNRYNNIT